MNTFKNGIRSQGFNLNYLHSDTLYEFCGDDLINFWEHPNDLRYERANDFFLKYKKNLVVASFFRSHFCLFPHALPGCSPGYYLKYANLSRSILDLSNREIFVLALEYFLDEDVRFLNVDAIYDEAESSFSSIIDCLRNDTCDARREINGTKEFYTLNASVQKITLVGDSNFMFYVDNWCRIMFSKIKSVSVVLRTC